MNFSRILPTLAIIITLLSPVALAASDQQNLNTITVTGNCIVEVSPDQAKVSISELSSALSAQASREENAKTSAHVKGKLASLGIPAEKISTANFTVSPVYSYNGKQQSITGYETSNTITVKLDDLSMVGTVIDTALSSGANKISCVNFSKKTNLNFNRLCLSKL